MTKMEFDTLLNSASSGNPGSMRTLAMLCFKMAEGGMNAGDLENATIYMELGNGWKKLSEQGEGYGSVSDQVRRLTQDMFSCCF